DKKNFTRLHCLLELHHTSMALNQAFNLSAHTHTDQQTPDLTDDAIADLIQAVDTAFERLSSRSALSASIRSLRLFWQTWKTLAENQLQPGDNTGSPSSIALKMTRYINYPPLTSAVSSHVSEAYSTHALRTALKRHVVKLDQYGSKRKYGHLEARLSNLLSQQETSSLDEMWWEQVKQHILRSNASPEGGQQNILPWYGTQLITKPIAEELHILHYARLKAGLRALRSALKTPANEQHLAEAATTLGTILWEGTFLSHDRAEKLWSIHHNIIQQLTTLCSIHHDSRDALNGLTDALLALKTDVLVEKCPKRSRRSRIYYQISTSDTPQNWRLLHNTAIQNLQTDYTELRRQATNVIRYIAAETSQNQELQAFTGACISLNNEFLWPMLLANTDNHAQISREQYSHALPALQNMLHELRER
ncbi:MAG: hypothetical protein OJI67_07185, partial [Prosthecobacter sp.]|nr:hypothetical protein [Prosthecobacter sp.]